MNEERVKERHKARETKKLLSSINHDATEEYILSLKAELFQTGNTHSMLRFGPDDIPRDYNRKRSRVGT